VTSDLDLKVDIFDIFEVEYRKSSTS